MTDEKQGEAVASPQTMDEQATEEANWVQPAPEVVHEQFSEYLAEGVPEGSERAVHYLYDLGVRSNYIHEKELAKNIDWTYEGPYGNLEITINLAKPEKDPKAIAAALKASQEAAAASAGAATDVTVDGKPEPKCDLCWENEEFPGTLAHPAKPGLRVCRIPMGGETWGFQYSPYMYFPEHCITMSEQHRPMKINGDTIRRLFDFVDQFPFYFIGSNADLPIVGGSILSHDHFQGGRHLFPSMKAGIETEVFLNAYPEIHAGIVHWPASVLRLMDAHREPLIEASTKVYEVWKTFSDPDCEIFAETDGTPHNTLNPILHKDGDTYVLDLVLRNNRTDEAHPSGIFHPPAEYHHIKKENIGLIEIMGRAILPARLAREMPLVQFALYEAVLSDGTPDELEVALKEDDVTASHAVWAADIMRRRAEELVMESMRPDSRSTIGPIIREEIGRVFENILESTGVFKHTETGVGGWRNFLTAYNEA